MIEQRDIKNFIDDWKARGDEKSDAQSFWLDLIRALGINDPTKFIRFEIPIDVDDHKCFIDGWIGSTKVLIEQKSRGIDLDKSARQSDGAFLNPFEQALRYAYALPFSQRPRWIVVCNFVELRVYDMDRYHQRSDQSYQPNVIAIERLTHEFTRLNFLIDPNDENVNPAIKISKNAIELINFIFEALKKIPHNLDEDALNKFCVRLMFCLYADDADIFEPNQFSSYLLKSDDRRAALLELFTVLNTPETQRPSDLTAELAAFPYVDGALFESILNPITRRKVGMHYTSIENIHKVIDPLFLDALHEEFRRLRRKKKNRRLELERFQLKLASLTFLDPACGSGNFLTETYLSLRRLENEVIGELYGLGVPCESLVSIENFFGIEINDFAVAVARTALWIAENQMLTQTESILKRKFKFLPLTRSPHIVCGNALRLDWRSIAGNVDYIIGNPPFVGSTYQSVEQKDDLLMTTRLDNKKLDYVVAWYYKSADFMIGNDTRAAFVSTNSICQGEQASAVWQPLFETVHIDFARRTFKWTSESDDMPAVHCVIVGFSAAANDRPKLIFDGDQIIVAENINAYLMDGSNFFIEKRSTPLCDVPTMRLGNMAADGGHLTIEADEYEEFIRREPSARKYIRRYMMGREFINGEPRYCLWLADATVDDLRLPLIAKRVDACRRYRAKTNCYKKLAATPHLFREQNTPEQFIVVPIVSSENRQYIPMGYLDSNVIVGVKVFMIPDAELFHFGVLTSSVHMAWTRALCGRLKSDYSYSSSIVYNNFPWCERTVEIEQTAQRILDVRAKYPSRTLAALYDPKLMPIELRAAHEANDRAVMSAYGFAPSLTESEIVSSLMSMYQRLTV
ncbi:MAG: class I SAM-dependent DNA methyltransferase [Selenomonadaceae bacterium]|nr:class I SAM-dependent DNA methyltransferase [Selenomonadaceae bacterium]